MKNYFSIRIAARIPSIEIIFNWFASFSPALINPEAIYDAGKTIIWIKTWETLHSGRQGSIVIMSTQLIFKIWL